MEVTGMVIRFNSAFARANELRDAVREGYVRVAGATGAQADGEQFTLFDVKRRVYLMDNLDLYVDDALPEDISGQFMMVLRSFGFLEEQAEIMRSAAHMENHGEQLQRAWGLFDNGYLDDARALYTACLARITEESHDDYCNALLGLVYVESFAENYAQARRYAQKLLALQTTPEEKHIFLHQCGMVERMAGAFDTAQAFFNEERKVIEEQCSADPMSLSVNLYEQAIIKLKTDQREQAMKQMLEAHAFGKASGDAMCVGCACRGMGEICLSMADKTNAAEWFAKAITAFSEAGDEKAVREIQDKFL